MSFLSDPIRTSRGIAVAGALGLLLIGAGIGRLTQRGRDRAPPASPDEKTPIASIAAGNREDGQSKSLGAAPNIADDKLRGNDPFERGYELAETDMDTALAELGSINDPATLNEEVARKIFLEGMFAYIGKHLDPKAATELAATLHPVDRRIALRGLAEAWTDGRSRTAVEPLIARFGLEVGVGLALASDDAYTPEIGEAWLAAFGDTKGVGVMLGTFAAKQLDDDPKAAIAMGAKLRGWDHEVFLRALTASWADKHPSDAWEWATRDAPSAAGNLGGVRADILTRWAQEDSAAASEALATLTDSVERRTAAAAIAEVIARRDGTVDAVNWANSLPSEADQEAAHGAIAKTAPQGIGAMLSFEDGFTVVRQLVPNGAADRSGVLQSGDRIVEVDPGTGEFELVFGRDLNRSMDLIRGEAGSTVRLRVVREDGNGSLQAQIIEVAREQIVLPGGGIVNRK